jgi:beta-carotene/zeaxanthin 4-ketolase
MMPCTAPLHGTNPEQTDRRCTAIFLFAGMSYSRLRKNHMMHHRLPAEAGDPDFYARSQNFWVWWGVFMRRYLTLGQIIIMAIVYNVFVHLLG